jgi:hypothetical protein
MFYGRQGLGKTTLMYQMAHSLVTGDPWMGLPIHQTGKKVLFMELDMPEVEFGFMQDRGIKGGLEIDNPIDVIHLEDYESFDVFDPAGKCYAFLKDKIMEDDPIALVIDTMDDAYDEIPKEMLADVNRLAKKVVNTFRRLIPSGLLLYSRHERKEPPYRGKGSVSAIDDKDAFTGGSGWERKVASSFRIFENAKETKFLIQNKHRLAPKVFGKTEVVQDENGLFRLANEYPAALISWPACLPESERAWAPASKIEVLKSVAEYCKANLATVKQYYYRRKKEGAVYGWEKMLDDNGPEEAENNDEL